MPHLLSRPAILRVLVSLMVAELASLSRREIAADVAAGWGPELPLGEEGLGLDSLERVGIASAVSRGMARLDQYAPATSRACVRTLHHRRPFCLRLLQTPNLPKKVVRPTSVA